jgi:hypothetical protein
MCRGVGKRGTWERGVEKRRGLQKAETKHGRQDQLLPPWELECPDDGHGEEEDEKVGDCHAHPVSASLTSIITKEAPSALDASRVDSPMCNPVLDHHTLCGWQYFFSTVKSQYECSGMQAVKVTAAM